MRGIKVGDEVYFHVTNLEQDWDIPHGFAMLGAQNSELLVMPGETRTLLVGSRNASACLPLLLHGLLFGAAPGDAGLRARLGPRLDRPAAVGHGR